MNAKTNTLNGPAVATVGAGDMLSGLERAALVLPLLGSLVFGILPLFFSQVFAATFGFSGNDPYLYALAGGVVLGYAPGLALGILQGEWSPVRLVMIAVLVFNVGSLFAIGVAVLGGNARPLAYLILVASVLFIAIALWLMNAHRDVPRAAADTAPWLKYLIIFLTAAAFGTGSLFLLAPGLTSQLFGFLGTDEFVFRQGAAATLGFAVMGVFELRSLEWREIRLPSLNALLFNGASLVATVLAILRGDPILLLAVVLLVTLVATLGSLVALVRQGK